MMNKCNHQWHVLAAECAVCGKPIEEYIADLEAQLEAVDELLFGTDEPLEHPVDIDALNDLFRKLRKALEQK